MSNTAEGIGTILFQIVLAVVFVGSWLTHVVFCLTTGKLGFLIAGAVFFPVGIVHGWMIWLGAA